MMALGTAAPDFSLTDVVSGKTVSLSDYAGKPGLLVMFICRHCPYVKHVQSELARLGSDYAAGGLGIVAIGANDAEKYPDDAPPSLKAQAEEVGFNFPYLFDESQDVARAYGAVCTPDFFLFDGQLKLAYRGQLDDSRPRNDAPIDGRDLRAAIDAVLAGQHPNPDQKPSVGCSIKWKQ
jgi:peroxiredoxin